MRHMRMREKETEEIKPPYIWPPTSKETQGRLFQKKPQTPPKWCPNMEIAAKEIDKAVRAIGTARNRLDTLRGKLEPTLNICHGQGQMFQGDKPMILQKQMLLTKELRSKLPALYSQENVADMYKDDPLMKTIHMQICPCILPLLSDKTNKQKLPVCNADQRAKREECIYQMKAANKDNGCKPEGDGSKRCPSPFAVCTASVGCRVGRKAS